MRHAIEGRSKVALSTLVAILIPDLPLLLYLLCSFALEQAGFRAWTVADFKSIMDAIAWHHMLAIAALFCLLTFRKGIAEYLDSIIEAKFGDVGWKRNPSRPGFEAAQVAQVKIEEENPNQKLTVEYVAQRMAEMPLVNKDTLKDSELAHSYFLRNGITTKVRFDALLGAEFIMNALADVMRQVMPKRRGKSASLDPVAISTWGAELMRVGPEQWNLNRLRKILRDTPEGRGEI